MPVNLQAPDPKRLFAVPGVELGIAMAGVRKANRRDLTIVTLAEGSTVAGVFTANRFCANDAELVARGECLIYFAFERSSGAFVGNVDLHSFVFSVPRGEIGYVGDSRRAGSGLMFEAATAVMKLGFELGLERIEAICDARNLRSIAFAEMLGMTREGRLRAHDRDPRGELFDDVVLAMLRGDPRPFYNRRPSPST